MVIIREDSIKQLNTPINIVIKAGGQEIEIIKTSFLGKLENIRKKK